ncbi:3'-5' exonuclease [Nocardia farcinica]|uniref:3'-5' exonuclease n=1 Tax=Nocardia farcinica TaxID=37329 RepID=UPI00245679C5|nr:3'-5' exonuclease [Nocardia farcinica]
MALVVWATNNKSMPRLDGSIKNKVYDFFEKVRADDTLPGLHIEPIQGAVDRRVRTGRVDINYRAIMFRIDGKAGDTTYIYLGTWKHDVANKLAEKSTLRVNPVNGVLEGIVGELDGQADRKKRSVVPDPTGQLARLAANPVGYLGHVGYTMVDLTDRLGLDPDLAGRALAAADQDELLTVAQDSEVAWQQNALLELAVGRDIEEIRDALGFTETPVDESLDENEQILAALDHPATKMQFTLIDDNDELRRVIEDGDFAAWRVFLHPKQRRYVERDYQGAFRLSGGAGTGKTVVALHRAKYLLDSDPGARVVLTTFNRTLATTMLADLRALDPSLPVADRLGDPGVYVAGVDSLAQAVVSRAPEPAYQAAAERILGSGSGARRRKRVGDDVGWAEAVRAAGDGLDPRLATTGFLAPEYVAVVLGNEVTTAEQYARVPRAGRGVRLSRAPRLGVWRVVEEYRRRGQAAGRLSYPEVLAVAAAILQDRAASADGHLADHVIVDEAQDLHATHWRLLRALVPEGPNDLFIAEDSHQRIYGQPVVLQRLGINIRGRSSRLTLNYRTTAQNLHFAVSILEGADYRDLEEGQESTAGYTCARLGPAPELIECASTEEQYRMVAETIRAWLGRGVRSGEIAVLTRAAQDRDRFVQELNRRDIPAAALDKDPATGDEVQVLTMHRGKGMEFRCVVLAGIDTDHVPARTAAQVPEEEQADARRRERSLLYVAASRARDELVVTWSGVRSELLR